MLVNKKAHCGNSRPSNFIETRLVVRATSGTGEPPPIIFCRKYRCKRFHWVKYIIRSLVFKQKFVFLMRMESLAEEYRNLSRRNTTLRRGRKQLSVGLLLLIGLLLLAIGYIIYIEFFTPFFGRWPQVQAQNNALQQKNEQLRSELDSMNRVNGLLLELSPYYTGVFFEVQIGAFEYFDLADYKDDLVKMNIDKTEQVDQYTLGKFRDLDRALAFRKDIQRMGIKDAFVIAKVDGNRVTVQEALAEQERLRN